MLSAMTVLGAAVLTAFGVILYMAAAMDPRGESGTMAAMGLSLIAVALGAGLWLLVHINGGG